MPNQKENKLDSLQEAYSDEISITDIIFTLWKKRGRIIIWSIIFTIIITAIGGIIFLTQSKYPVYKLNFYLNFTGLSKKEYPNGSRFSVVQRLPGVIRVNCFKIISCYPGFCCSCCVW